MEGLETGGETASPGDRDEAARLYERAKELHRRRDYDNALGFYQRSLRLREDEEVRASYLELLAIIGPE